MAQASIQNAATAGLAYLARSQNGNGEFPMCASPSRSLQHSRCDQCVFATSLVLQFLVDAPLARTSRVAAMRRSATRFLLDSSVGRGLFSYYAPTHTWALPPDADDTACASMALSSTHPFYAFHENRQILLDSRDSEGRFQTWIEPFSLAPNNVDLGVNANVLFYLGYDKDTRSAFDYVTARALSGDLTSRYYIEPLFTCYLISRICQREDTLLKASIQSLRQMVRAQECGDGWYGSAQRTACAILVLHGDEGSTDHISRGIRRLLVAQHATGAWARAAIYRSAKEYFGHSALSTALVLHALAKCALGPSARV